MRPEFSLKTYGLEPKNGGAPDSVLIFAHGFGDSGSGGLLDIARVWQRVLPRTLFLCPDAPFAFDAAPPDFGGRQWFSLRTFTPKELDDGVQMAAPYLNIYIDEVLAAFGLPASRLALAGFSQGAMMSLYVAPRRAEPVACVLAYSGVLTNGETLNAEKRCASPVLLVHGTADDRVPFAAMADAKRRLKEADIPVQTLACPGLGHGIDDEGIAMGMSVLQQQLT